MTGIDDPEWWIEGIPVREPPVREPLPDRDKFYVIVRADMSPGYQAVQAMHAAINLCLMYPQLMLNWWSVSNTLILLSVPNIYQLHLYEAAARDWNILSAFFYEPDIDEYTALALLPSDAAAELTQDLPLALRNKKWWRFWE